MAFPYEFISLTGNTYQSNDIDIVQTPAITNKQIKSVYLL